MGKIFISYAREDSAMANRLYNDLKKLGADPWLDTEDLLPGQRWGSEIKKVIRDSSHFFILLSKNSVTKRGFVQKELNFALNVLEEIPPDDIYILPLRLDDTYPLHDKLQELHWLDLFPSYPTALKKIKSALATSGAIVQRRSVRKEISLAEARDAFASVQPDLETSPDRESQ